MCGTQVDTDGHLTSGMLSGTLILLAWGINVPSLPHTWVDCAANNRCCERAAIRLSNRLPQQEPSATILYSKIVDLQAAFKINTLSLFLS